MTELLASLTVIFVSSTIAGAGFMLGGLAVCKLLGKSPVNVTTNAYIYRDGVNARDDEEATNV